MKEIGNWRHICVDVQRMFAEDTPWHVAWMKRVLPELEAFSKRHAERTIFTRFLPPRRADDANGNWKSYYRKWWMMTGEHLHEDLIGLQPSLQALVPPALVFDKMTYSPWVDGRLALYLRGENVDTVAVTGGETDVCVLATVLGAIDLGFHVVVMRNAVCSGMDQTHDAALDLIGARFSSQLELMTTEQFLSSVNV